MNRKITVLLISLSLLACMLVGLFGCGPKECKHEWTDATCTSPKTCTLCSATDGEALGHTGGSATCTEKATCSLCNEKYGELAAHDLADATCTQAKKCKNCDYTEGAALGHSGGVATCKDKAVCKTCNQPYGELIAHSFTNNSNAEQYLASAATCTASAKYYRSCAGCGKAGEETFSYGDPLQHNYELETSNNNGTHTLGCTGCEATKTEDCFGGSAYCGGQAICNTCKVAYGSTPAHAWDEGVVTTKPTCEADGVRTYTCSGCNANETKPEPALGHDYDSVVTSPTCELEGYTTHTCKREGCDDSYVDAKVVSLGHDLKDVAQLDPTCTDDGHTAYQKCSRCDHETAYTILSANGHNWQNATCTAPKTCSVCSETEGETLPHSYAPATCTTPKTCKNCPATEGEALGHNWLDADCLNPRRCSVCKVTDGDSLGHIGGTATCNQQAVCERDGCGKSYGAYADHNFSEQNTASRYLVSAATCDNVAVYNYSCQCGATDESRTFEYGEALGHDFYYDANKEDSHIIRCYNYGCTYAKTESCLGGTATCQNRAVCEKCNQEYGVLVAHSYGKWETTTPAGCINNGVEIHTCSSCGASETNTLPATGHSYEGEHSVVTVKATCTSDGYTTYSCDNCDYSYVTDRVEAPGHNYSTQVIDPDCTNKGYTTFTCACGDSYVGAEVEATGHNYSEKVTAPTCKDKGYTTFTCACGDSYVGAEVEATGHDYSTKITPPTCKDKGYTTFTCACGDSYKGNETNVVDHTWNKDRSCTEGHECTVCGATEAALGHNHVKSKTVNPTCTVDGYTVYACTRCTDSYNADVVTALGHNIEGVEAVEVSLGNCNYKQTFKCKICGETVDGQNFVRHSYTASITTEPTCSTDGLKTLTCACGDTKTESVPQDALGHNWVLGTPANGKRTDKCSLCQEEKTVIDASNQTETKVEADDLKNEVALKDANLDLSGIAGEGGVLAGKEDLSVSAGTLTDDEKNGLELSDELKAQVGNNPIYNFTITSGNETVSDFGKDNYVTVTLPYTLSEGEDVDSIAIWFINDKGDVESIKATYANGFVTFQTNHFSYYTVTKLTPAQRCELYGHNEVTKTVEATCTEDGYTLTRCIRCGWNEKTDIVTAPGHSLTTETVNATCTANGKVTVDCSNCDYHVVQVITAGGHQYAEESRVDATCKEVGYIVYKCSGCDASYSVEIAKVPHNYVSEVIAPDCNTLGYTKHTCSDCENSYSDNYKSALKHDYASVVTKDASCTEAGLRTYTCKNCDNSYTEVIAALKHNYYSVTTEPTCSAAGSTTHTCTACGHSYVDGHMPAVNHVFTSTVVDPECGKQGYTHYDCDFCDYSYNGDFVPAVDHLFDDNSCQWTWSDDYSTAHYVLSCANDCGHKVEGDLESSVRYIAADCEVDGRYEYTVKFTYNEKTYIDTKSEYNPEDLAGHRIKDGYTHNEHEHWIGCRGCSEKHALADHEWIDIVVTTQPTCNKHGWVSKTCYCGRTVKEKIPATEDHYYQKGYCVVCGEEQNFCDHTELEEKTIDFAELGYCEGTLVYNTCKCGAISEFADLSFDLSCDIVTDTEEQGATESGMWAKMTGHCPDCGLLVAADLSMTLENCVQTYKVDYTFYHYNGEVIVSASLTQSAEHHVESEIGPIGLAEVSSCGSELYGRKCVNCDKILYVSNFDRKCQNVVEDGDYGVLENGNEYQWDSETCLDCGLVYYERLDAEWHTPCEYTIVAVATISINGVEYFRYSETRHDDMHDYQQVKVEMNGESCLDGYTVTYHCPKCDDFYYRRGESHDSQYVSINLENYGMCYGYGYSYVCSICNKITDSHMEYYECQFMIQGQDENGYTISHCSSCNTDLRTKTTLVSDADKCRPVYTYEQLFYRNGELVLDLSFTRTEQNHNYQYDVEGNCDDYFIHAYCLDCGYTTNFGGGGHFTEHIEYNLADYGLCNATISIERCIICGYGYNVGGSFGCNFDMVANHDNIYILECSVCHGVIYMTEQDVVDGCKVTSTELYEIYVEKELVLTLNIAYNTRYNHYYKQTVTGDCENGYVLESVCLICGETSRYEGRGHRNEEHSFDLKEYGLCGGEGYKNICTICGKETGGYINNSNCDWQFVEAVDGVNIYSCENCGAIKTTETVSVEVDENCFMRIQTEINFFMKEERVFGYAQYMGTYRHDYVYNFTFANPDAPNCMDGVQVVLDCNNCDYNETLYWTNHITLREFELDTTQYDICAHHVFSHMTCPCGQYMDYGMDGEHFEFIDGAYRCNSCSMVVTDREDTFKEGCTTINRTEMTLYINDEEIYTVHHDRKSSSHNFELYAPAQMDGNPYIEFCCQDCGYSFVYTRTDLLSGVVTLEYQGGQYYYDLYFTPEESANYNITSNTYGDTHVTLYRLNEYGGFIHLDENDDGADNNNFSLNYYLEAGVTYVYRIRFLDSSKSGEIFYSLSYNTAPEGDRDCYHIAKYKSVLIGDNTSCNDGAYSIRMCDCGKVYSVNVTYTHSMHEKIRYEFEQYGSCANTGVQIYGCACNSSAYTNWYGSCEFTGWHEGYTDENGVYHNVYISRCVYCGLTYTQDSYSDGSDLCYDYSITTYTYSMGEEEIFSLTSKQTSNSHHSYDYTFEFLDPNNMDCESGVRMNGVCVNCGTTTNSVYYYHSLLLRETYNLSEQGCCEGSIAYYYACACGKNERLEMNFKGCGNTYGAYRSYVDENGIRHEVYVETCEDCGLRKEYSYYYYKENCMGYICYEYFTLYMGNNVIATSGGYSSTQGESHDYATSIKFHDENNRNCEAGYTITYTCRDCGNSYPKDRYNHSYVLTEYIDLSAYSCDSNAYIEYSGCACGLKQEVNQNICSSYNHTYNTYEDENGRLINIETIRCPDCGLRLDVSYYDEKSDGCFVNRYFYYILTCENEIIYEKSFVTFTEVHDLVINGVLDEGAKDCYDGLTLFYTCRYCDYYYSERYSHHVEYEHERIDATKYGSDCGGYISIYGCTCGYYASINTEGLLCDTSHRGAVDWIEGDLNEYHYTAEEERWFETRAYLIDCAVTDDATGTNLCGFAVRYATYWIKNDDCSATKYLVIQLGYDANDGSYIEEKIYTIETRTFHNYGEQINIDNGWKRECPDCGSWYSKETVHYANNEGYYNRYVYVNNLDDGCNKYREYINEWKNNDELNLEYHSMHYNMYIYADGTEYWDRWEYEYEAYYGEVPFGESPRIRTERYTDNNGYESNDIYLYTMLNGYDVLLQQKRIEGKWWCQYDYTWSFDNGCNRTYVYTDANGGYRTGSEKSCHPTWWWTTLTNPTCSQQGIEGRWCPVCEKLFNRNYFAPEGHNWIWLADDLYYCYDCGLQGQGGSDGDVIIEDLTDRYGNGENYVLGYYNTNGVAFTIKVSLMVYVPEWDDYDQIVLELEPTLVDDLYRGAYISKAAVKAAAEELGLAEGEYEVRMSFVPDGADSSFDYAITFGDLRGHEAADFAIHDDASMVVYAPLADFTTIKVVSETTADWRFYSTTHYEVYGCLVDEEGNFLKSGYNYDFTYTLEAGKTYYLQVYHTNSQGGYVAVFFDKMNDVTNG